MKRHKNIFILVVLITLVFSYNVSAGTVNGANYSYATQTGGQALNINPAAVNIDSRFSMGSFVKGELFNNLLINSYMDKATKDQLLDKIDKWLITTELQGGGHLAIGPVAGFFKARGNGYINLPYQTAELLLEGNSSDNEKDLMVNFSEVEGKSAVLGDAGFNLSFKVPQTQIHLGLNYHYLTGMIFAVQGNGEIGYRLDEEGEPDYYGNGKIKVKSNDPATNLASGSVFDIGLYSKINKKLSLGMSLNNIGQVSCNKFRYLIIDPSDLENTLPDDEWKQSEVKLTWNPPLTTNAGIEYQLTDGFELLGNFSYTKYNANIKDVKYSITSRLSYISSLPLEMGVNYSTMKKDTNINCGMGLYLGPLKTKVSITDMKGFFNKAKGSSITFSNSLSF